LYNSFDKKKIESILWIACKQDPTQHLIDYVIRVEEYGYQCSKEYIRKIFKAWRWSFKKPCYKQLAKYSDQNVKNYFSFLIWLKDKDYSKLKFMDEVHFVSKDVSRRRALGPLGVNIILIRNEHFAETYSFSCLTNLAGSERETIYISGRTDSNTQIDFIKFIVSCLESRYLIPGDYLICDNASIHAAADTYDILEYILDSANVKLIFLPAYSPELNPIELVFMKVKRYLREYRCSIFPLCFDICNAFSKITKQDLINFYRKCFLGINTSLNQITSNSTVNAS